MRVDVDVLVAEHLVGASLNVGLEVAVVGSVGLADEDVGELIADQRLDEVVEVGQEHLGRGDAGRDGTVVGVDELDDAQVVVEHQHAVRGCRGDPDRRDA
ncbi:MAG: hypothetical protein WBP81_08410 [Solirubrobacteraceae bacterium]